jgi:hypothetical protein
MKIKYTDETGQLNTLCPHGTKITNVDNITCLVGSVYCRACSNYKETKAKYTMECKHVR